MKWSISTHIRSEGALCTETVEHVRTAVLTTCIGKTAGSGPKAARASGIIARNALTVIESLQTDVEVLDGGPDHVCPDRGKRGLLGARESISVRTRVNHCSAGHHVLTNRAGPVVGKRSRNPSRLGILAKGTSGVAGEVVIRLPDARNVTSIVAGVVRGVLEAEEAYPVDSGSPTCSVLSGCNRAVTRARFDGRRSFACPIPEGLC